MIAFDNKKMSVVSSHLEKHNRQRSGMKLDEEENLFEKQKKVIDYI